MAGTGRVECEWVDFVADLLATPLTAFPEERIAAQLRTTFSGLGCAFHIREYGRVPVQRIYQQGSLARLVDELNTWAREQAATAHPILRYYLATGDTTPVQVAEVPVAVVGARTLGSWYELGRQWDIEHQFAIRLLGGGAADRSFVLGRTEPFTPAEMALTRRLQRLLTGLDRQSTALAAAGAPAHEVAADVRLTPRELAVLTLLARGMTASTIARRLDIAERTVHKHLERTYAKLAVTDRLSAVLRAQRIGLLPGAT
ncbi:helix-turn-helix transcriptional regulator [Pseudonocardia sp. H11422]|uniref:helix-turn-helix transcriptional regulator n=1 Tax=Pseudonocardia sp. H11422 TaxID=2835866 RepID=UPI001BDDA567|nr:LuxR C-terminal-related transcriptional regulator [Pseudonocardia sp. H11422]